MKEALGHKKSNRDWLKDHKLFKGTLGSNQDLAGIIPFNQWLWPGCYSPAEPKENREVPTPTCFVQARVMAIIPIFQALYDGSTNGLFTLFEQWQYQYLNDYKNGRGSNVKLSKVNKTAMKIRGLFSGYLNKYVRKIFPKPQRAIYLSLHKRRLRWNTFRRGTKTVQNNQSVSNDNESPNEENKNE
ncbi:MAG: hypothetical protein GY941_00690, partial [Planctomycetes bacterium]|nr:hypothetical protein [Planctomycetota bacterium]